MQEAERLDRALIQFAATGRGPARRVNPRDPRRLVLVVPGAGAFMFADDETGTLRITAIFRRS